MATNNTQLNLKPLTTALKAAVAPEAPKGQTKEAPKPEAAKMATDEGLTESQGEPSTQDLEALFPAQGSESIEAEKIQGSGVTSVGDPHETTGDGMKFDNMEKGIFVKMRSALGDFELQTRQEPWEKNPQATVNTAAAIKVNGQGDKVVATADGKLTFNGKPVEVKEGEPFEIPGGGQIEKQGDAYVISSAAGDKVTALDRGSYLDVRVDGGPDRRDGDLAGSLGRLDSDTDFKNDLVDRDGKPMDDIAAFIETWRAQPGESMLDDTAIDAPDEQQPTEGAEAPEDKPEVTEPVAGAGEPEGEKPAEADGKDAQIKTLLAELLKLLKGEEPVQEAPKAPAAEAPVEEAKKPEPQKGEAGAISPEVMAMLAELLKSLEAAEGDAEEAQVA